MIDCPSASDWSNPEEYEEMGHIDQPELVVKVAQTKHNEAICMLVSVQFEMNSQCPYTSYINLLAPGRWNIR